MGRIVLLSQNRADEAVLTSPGQWQAPLSNLQTRFLAQVARSQNADPEKTQFDAALPQRRAIRGLVLPNVNLSPIARFRVSASRTADRTALVYDSEWQDAYRRLYSWRELRWGNPRFWFGRPSEEDLEGFRRNLIHVLPETVDAAYWRVEIDDQTNPTGFVEAGRLFLAGGAQPTYNYSYGAQLSYETTTRVDKSRTGVKYFERRDPVRVFRFTLQFLPEQEVLERWLEVQRRMGLDGEVFVIMDPDDDPNLSRTAFLGTLRTLSPMEQTVFERASIGFEIEEII